MDQQHLPTPSQISASAEERRYYEEMLPRATTTSTTASGTSTSVRVSVMLEEEFACCQILGGHCSLRSFLNAVALGHELILW
jgi:hypothetical protein